MKNILIIGATSAIAIEFARLFPAESKVFLVARDVEKLESVFKDLRVRKPLEMEPFVLDVNDYSKFDEMFTAAKTFLQNIDTILIAHGTFPDQEKCNLDTDAAINAFNTNATSTIALCQQSANILEEQKSGTLAVITSVAGDRGRQSNCLYGSAKGAVNVFLQGLRNRLTKSNVKVLTIKPGFVDTPMTADIPKNPLFSKPEAIAKGISKAIERGKSKEIYLPGYWKIIMLIIKLIPNKIFNKLSL